MIYSLVGQLVRHRYVWVEEGFIREGAIGFVPAVWFGLVSYPGRMWGCTVMLECGAVYRNLPPQSLAFRARPEGGEWGVRDAQTWDCYGTDFSVIEYGYLTGLDCVVRANGREHDGSYLFTVAPVGDGFSAYPEQSKEFSFIEVTNGRLTVQPTNHIVFRERSFTGDELEFPKTLLRQTRVWSCE